MSKLNRRRLEKEGGEMDRARTAKRQARVSRETERRRKGYGVEEKRIDSSLCVYFL